MFNHSNIKLAPEMEKRLRYVIVTPDMHRIHHSTLRSEHGANFGFNFPWWDRIFGTYQAQPALGHEEMHVGIKGLQDRQSIEYFALLAQPFKRD